MRLVRSAALFAAVLAVVGCGGNEKPPTVTAKGTVTVAGAPLAAGTIYLVVKPGEQGRDEFTQVKDGAFEFKAGVFRGKYLVAFDTSLPTGKTSTVPAKYRKTDTSELEADLTSDNAALKFDLK